MKVLKNAAVLLAVTGFITVSSCKKEDPIPVPNPEACFSFVQGTPGEITEFFNCSKNAETYRWDFGDGSFSNSQNVTHVYVTGTYFVSLTATNSAGVNAIHKRTLQIVDKPVTMIINKIVLRKWPASNNGVAWDNSSYPDIFPIIKIGGNEIWTSSLFYENCSPSNEYEYDLTAGLPFTIDSLSESLTIGWYDYDDMPNDYMGETIFTPITGHYPNSGNVLGFIDGDWAFSIHVSWTY